MKCLLRWLAVALLLSVRALEAQDRTSSPHGTLSVHCTTCHRADAWSPVRIAKSFDHGKLGFTLQGAHATASCRACHQTLDFKGTSSTCASCHKDVHRGELGVDCSSCHTPRSFLDRSAMLKAHQTSRFPLEGAHLAVDCTACHTPTGQGRQQFVSRGAECVSCHQQDFVAAKSPDHLAGGFSRDCVNCHTSTIWGRGRFNHDASSFPLTGAHRATGCLQCHAGNRYQGTPNQCAACHQADYDQTATPKHSTAGFGTDCATCHATNSWTTAFDHSASQFPLTGAHRASTCAQCHADGVYAGKPTTCVSCHQTDYTTAANPRHTPPSYPTTCLSCHTTTTWVGAAFDHNATQFPLTGAHRASTCTQCHADGVYAGKPTSCVSCHQTDYNSVVTPKHTLPSFPASCTPCHTTTVWIPSSFSHATTAFRLTGMHTTAPCASCHINGVYRGTATVCQSCHLADYTSAVSPNHLQYGWPQTCTTCHSGSANTQAWDAGVTLSNQYHTMFSLNHENSRGVCTQCHNTTNFAQSTCSNHHHPPSCTFLNRGSCD
ncbi:MAG: hypothetical protein ABI587_13095 [Gemmatimonadales bacterium]